MKIKYYKIENFEKEDVDEIKNIIIKSRGLFSGIPQAIGVEETWDNHISYVFKFGDVNNKSNSLTNEKNEELLKEVKKEIKELNETYEVKNYEP